MPEGYNVACICLNGHVISQFAATQPEHSTKFCSTCGDVTIKACRHCATSIRGHYSVPGVVGFYDYHRPSFCFNCGQPYPWTERAIVAATELISEESNLAGDDSAKLAETVKSLTIDSAQTPVAASRLKKTLSTLGKATAEGVKSILVNVITESAKRSIWS